MAGRPLQSYIDEYGDEEGRKMHSRLQSMSGMKSQHVQQLNRLANEEAEQEAKETKND
jgi:hypothetical protein